MDKVLCKRDFRNFFKKNKYYRVVSLNSIFDKNDFILVESNLDNFCRFRMNTNKTYIEDYIGYDEYYFYDYFYDEKEERKEKLINLSK